MERLLVVAAAAVLVAVQALVWREAGKAGGLRVTLLYLAHLLGVTLAVAALVAQRQTGTAGVVAGVGVGGVAGFVSASLRRGPHPDQPFSVRHHRGLRQLKLGIEAAVAVAMIATLVTVVDHALNKDFNSRADTGLCQMLRC